MRYPEIIKLRRHDVKCSVRIPNYTKEKYISWDWCDITATYGFEGGNQYLCAKHGEMAKRSENLPGITMSGRFVE